MNNPLPPLLPDDINGTFISTKDGTRIFLFAQEPVNKPDASVYIISGITGINHNKEQDVIDTLAGDNNRIIVIHPRGTGYSDGTRGDIDKFDRFLEDYVEVIKEDFSKQKGTQRLVLYGHSMSTAVAMHIAAQFPKIDGIILINPPFKMKDAEGMTPGIGDYIKYAGYYIFASHTPIVNMAGDPNLIKNDEERREAEERQNDPFLVKYFSMYMMSEAKKLMDSMGDKAGTIESPLLLIYGTSDSIVEKSGCDAIFSAWKSENKQFILIEKGPHGKGTVLKAGETIREWIRILSTE